MRFRRDRAVAHRSRAEPLNDFRDRLNFFQRNRIPFFEFQQTTQMTLAGRLLVDGFRKSLVGFFVAGCSSSLDIGDILGRPGMLFSIGTPVVHTGIRQYGQAMLFALRITDVMTHFAFFRNHVEPDPFDAAGSSGKAGVNNLIIQTNGFKDLGSFITLQS